MKCTPDKHVFPPNNDGDCACGLVNDCRVTKPRNYTKFFTPDHVADFLVAIAALKPGYSVLEPHAGNGQIIRAIRRRHNHTVIVDAIELNEDHLPMLQQEADRAWSGDFLHTITRRCYDVIIANPPFGNGVDLYLHYMRMRESVMQRNGRIVMICPMNFVIAEEYEEWPLENWSANSDGTMTELKVIRV